tara:strand:- start:124 stop:405 length:282 start_codon:yes stop_codon:yes gene_type:complete
MIYKALEKIEKGEGGYLFYTKNLFTGNRAVFTVTFSEMEKDGWGDSDPFQDAQDWADGELVQNAFRYLYPAEREMLITGILPEDWHNINDLGE